MPTKPASAQKQLLMRLLRVKNQRQLRRRLTWLVLLILVSGIALYSYLTNPFVRFSVIVDPHARILIEEKTISVSTSEHIRLRDDAFFSNLARLKASWHIISSRFGGGHRADAGSTEKIIAEIHALRFDPSKAYLISGDHFSVLYPRSLGIFYHTILDPRTALSTTDWQNRQAIYLKTLAYCLSVYDQTSDLSTTIVPIAPQSVVLSASIPLRAIHPMTFTHKRRPNSS